MFTLRTSEAQSAKTCCLPSSNPTRGVVCPTVNPAPLQTEFHYCHNKMHILSYISYIRILSPSYMTVNMMTGGTLSLCYT